MKFCNTPSARRTAYTLEGADQTLPLVLLHGFCEDHSVWAPIRPMLQQQRLILVDLPGFGASDLPLQADMRVYAEAVLAVLDQEGIEKCVLVGHSMGGYVGLEFAAHWPERLAGLGLFHSHPFTDTEERKTVRQRGIETLEAGKRDLYVAQLFPNLFAADFIQTHPETLHHLIDNGKKQSASGIITALQAMIHRRDHQSTLAGLPCPALFLLGAQDALVPAAQALQAALLPSISSVYLFPHLAHMAMWEAPDEAANALLSFGAFCKALPRTFQN